ncbi:MAG: DNA mismatch repair protein MutS, partial [Anaerolineales bacterium]|nr:DNA mismatch repair protein MutS [Anaerolineales bacterium]
MADTTPVREQYLQIKAQHSDALVFFRLGDFYETFDEDAEIAARELDLVLTSRPVSKSQRIPMAGVPYHAVEGYIARLIEKGYRVAIAEQVGEVTGRGLVTREVTRVVTPGTVVEPALLDERRPSYLAAVVWDGARAGLAYADITTGEFATTQLDAQEVEQEVARLQPRECLVAAEPGVENDEAAAAFLASLRATTHVTPLPSYRFELGVARQALLDHFQVATLEGFGCAGLPLAIRAAGAVIHYLQETQKGVATQIASLSTYSTARFMALDAATRRNLELTETIRERRPQGSLLGILDQTLTPMGGRLLRTRLAQPLLDPQELEKRLDQVQAFYEDTVRRAQARDVLRGAPDLERLTNRIVGDIARPRDLVGVSRALAAAPTLRTLLDRGEPSTSAPAPDARLAPLAALLDPCEQITA